MNTFRVHLKNGNSFTVKAHHFVSKASAALYTPVQFYKDENTVDETILVIAAEVAAIVPAEGEAPSAAAGGVSRSSSGVHV